MYDCVHHYQDAMLGRSYPISNCCSCCCQTCGGHCPQEAFELLREPDRGQRFLRESRTRYAPSLKESDPALARVQDLEAD
jgi:hypothetical protein